MRFIDPRLCTAAVLAILLAGCSAPAPKPSTAPPQTAVPAAGTEPSTAQAPVASDPSPTLKKQFAMGVAAMKAGDDNTARGIFIAIAKLHPQLASPHTNLGILYYRQGESSKAEASFKEALERDDKDYVAANYLGLLYRAQGRFEDARAAYLQSLAAKPDYGYAHLNMAILYDLYLGELHQALDHYQQYRQEGGADDPRLAGWLADLQQRINDSRGNGNP